MVTYYGSSKDNGTFLSSLVEVNGVFYLSGQVHADSELQLHGDTIEDKFFYTMKRIEEKLSLAELTKKDIVRVQIYLVDIKELPSLNKVYAQYFDHPMPVRTAVSVTALPLGASLEIDIIAVRSTLK